MNQELQAMFDNLSGKNRSNAESLPVFDSSQGIEVESLPKERMKNPSDKIHISVWGCFKTGKSSLINALLNEKILPVKTTSATGVVTKIYYAPKKTAHVVLKDGTRKAIDWDELEDYIVIREKTIHYMKTSPVERVEIGIDNVLLKEICLLDLPGDEDDPILSEKAFEVAMRSDIVIVVMSAIKLMSEKERQNIDFFNKELKGNLLFAVNKVDFLDHEDMEDIRNYTTLILHDKGNEIMGYGDISYCNSGKQQIGIENFRQKLLELQENPYWILEKKLISFLINHK